MLKNARYKKLKTYDMFDEWQPRLRFGCFLNWPRHYCIHCERKNYCCQFVALVRLSLSPSPTSRNQSKPSSYGTLSLPSKFAQTSPTLSPPICANQCRTLYRSLQQKEATNIHWYQTPLFYSASVIFLFLPVLRRACELR